MDFLSDLDTRLFLAINGWHSETWDAIMVWISGETTWWPFYLLLLVFLGWKKRWELALMILFIPLVITITDQTSVHLFKNLFMRFRPCHEFSLRDLVHTVDGKCGGAFGFISSHAANSFGVAMLLYLWVRRWWFGAVMLFWAALICYSRVYLGVHYPGDVIGGAIWGAFCGYLVFLLFRWTKNKQPGKWLIRKWKREFAGSA
ncbi:MAG: phosphatase PAP2 family protein [Bacteroidales bacterium]|nr:phosphatase PAP2 family protein [Bacteroidales bacterium]